MEQASVTKQQVADKCRVSSDTVTEWLTGEDSPSKTQFNNLVALLKRPTSFFFLAEPPALDTIPPSFRHPPGEMATRRLLPEEARAVRRARRFQRISEWIRTSSGTPAPVLPLASPNDSPSDVAEAARRVFAWSPQDQFEAESVSMASHALRARLESHGLIFLNLPLTDKGCRGFSLYNAYAPLIAVNTAYNQAARIFSACHELGHLILKTESICETHSPHDLESWCDSFAAAFLMPKSDVIAEYDRLKLQQFSKGAIAKAQKLASRFNVSLRAAAIRLIDLGFEPASYYFALSATEFKSGRGGGTGETSPQRRLREWGTTYPQLLLSAEERNLLTRQDILEYLNLSNTQLRILQELLIRHVSADE